MLGGELIDFHAATTCMAVDATEGRAWIGGVVTQNKSTHLGWLTDIHEPGDDVWFRVLDVGEGSAEPDRSTFFGFEGAAGIITSGVGRHPSKRLTRTLLYGWAEKTVTNGIHGRLVSPTHSTGARRGRVPLLSYETGHLRDGPRRPT